MDKKVQAVEECCGKESSVLHENARQTEAQQEAASDAGVKEAVAAEDRLECSLPEAAEETIHHEEESAHRDAAEPAEPFCGAPESITDCSAEAAVSNSGELKQPVVEAVEHFVAKTEMQTPAPQDELVETKEAPASEEPVMEQLEVQKPVSLFYNGLTGFGITQQGESHKRKGNIPCQDSMEVRMLRNSPIILSAVADGVGECEYSHYGSRRAVAAVLDVLQERLEDLAGQENFVFRDHERMQGLMLEAFRAALNAVDKLAEDMKKLPFSFQSTLTAAVYDGSQLYIGHAGDDGLVALAVDGSCKMLTRRHKGEASNSVFPLQARNMDFIAVDQEIAAFALMTDGVLDAVVGNDAFENRVYYPFFKQLFETVLLKEEDVRELCDAMDNMLASKGYRERVTDDLSLVVVTNQQLLVRSEKPRFDAEAWDRQTVEISKKINAKLYPSDPPKPKCESAPPRPNRGNTPLKPKSGNVPPKADEPAGRSNPPVQNPVIRQNRPISSERGRPDYPYYRPGTCFGPADDKRFSNPPVQERHVNIQQRTEELLTVLRTLEVGEEIRIWVRDTMIDENGSLKRVRIKAQGFRNDVMDRVIEAINRVENKK